MQVKQITQIPFWRLGCAGAFYSLFAYISFKLTFSAINKNININFFIKFIVY